MNYQLLNFINALLEANLHFTVTSAKRTPEQNVACKGASNSQHLTGDALDFKPYGSTSMRELRLFIEDNWKLYDQLILYPTFIHISFARTRKNRQQYIDKR